MNTVFFLFSLLLSNIIPGPVTTVFLNNLDSVIEAMVKKKADFASRPPINSSNHLICVLLHYYKIKVDEYTIDDMVGSKDKSWIEKNTKQVMANSSELFTPARHQMAILFPVHHTQHPLFTYDILYTLYSGRSFLQQFFSKSRLLKTSNIEFVNTWTEKRVGVVTAFYSYRFWLLRGCLLTKNSQIVFDIILISFLHLFICKDGAIIDIMI